MEKLNKFIGYSQIKCIEEAMKGEEKDYFSQMVLDLQKTISNMPKTHETDGQGDNALVHLHYFRGNADWWITEKDMEDDQLQAFGLACLNGDVLNAELGYISIEELLKFGVELDLYWTPKTIGEIKEGLNI